MKRLLAGPALVLAIAAGGSPSIAQSCPDDDLDGFADCSVAGCDPTGLTCGDCDDGDDTVSPDGTETCNHVDDDCDGRADEDSATVHRKLDLEFPDAFPDDQLGAAHASLGDITGDGVVDLVVAFGPGQLRLVSGGSLQEICRTPSDTEAGYSVSRLGDVTDDGVPDFVSTIRTGFTTTIFSGADCSVIRTCRADDFNPRAGGPVVGMDDVSGDGLPDYVLGRPNLHRVTVVSSANCSTVYDVDRPAGTDGTSIGTSVDVIDDLDDDGIREILTGLPEAGDTLEFGSVRIYSGADGSEIRVHPGAGTARSEYGAAASGIGDLDGDGIEEYAIGAPDDDHGVGDEGSVWIHAGADGTLLALCRGEILNGRFGSRIASGLDLDGDGEREFLVSSVGEAAGGVEDAGTVAVVAGTSCDEIDKLSDDDPDADEDFGAWPFSMPGDLNDDGIPEILVGSPLDDPFGLEDTGSLSIFYYQSDCDGDGSTRFAGDCDDTRATVLPGGPEACDALDNDCDGMADEDNDGDGHLACADCDNENPTIYPGAAESCNGMDDDCDGTADEGPDSDGDGHTAPCDCDDADANVNPGQQDTCNHVDDDCDGRIDDGRTLRVVEQTLTQSGIGRSLGFGATLAALEDVDNDGAAEIIVGMPDDDSILVYSGRDRSLLCRIRDPTGADRLGSAVAGIGDLTGDGVADILAGDPSASKILVLSGADCSLARTCSVPQGSTAQQLGRWVAPLSDLSGDGIPDFVGLSSGKPMVLSGSDCSLLFRLENPHAAGAFAGSFPLGVPDMTADGIPDIVVASRIFSGRDGVWDRNLVEPLSELVVGNDLADIGDITGDGTTDFAAIATHLDDDGKNVGALAFVSGRDGSIIRTCPNPDPQPGSEFGTAPALIGDLDGDGFPEVATSAPLNDLPGLLVRAGAVHVISSATCRVMWTFLDSQLQRNGQFGLANLGPGDLDGNGIADLVTATPRTDIFAEENAGSMTVLSFGIDCDGDGITPASGDCDDQDRFRFPGAVEVCDGADNDCDAEVDEDSDLDGADACSDCDVANASIFPGAPERCNGIDDDCDGEADQGEDLDGDGRRGVCDCDESAPDVYFGAAESCNAVDDDCDGLVDEESPPVVSTRKASDPVPEGGRSLGESVAVLGDVTGDGVADFVTAGGYAGNGQPPGIIVSGSDLSVHCRLDPPSPQEYESVAAIPDLTGDGITDVIAGTLSNVSVALFSGADCSYMRGCEGGARGRSVTSIADITGDGVAEIFSATWAGASVYSGSDCSVILDMQDPYGVSSDHFGEDVLDLGDHDADGFPEVVVVAPRDSTPDGIASGSLSLFSTADGEMLRKVSPGAFVNGSPCALASLGDITGDGILDLANALCGERSIQLRSGADLSLIRTCADNTSLGGFIDLTAVDDLDGDGVRDIAAGDTAAGLGRGNVVIFSGADCTILAELSDPAGQAGDLLGIAMAAADLTGDGIPEILAGARGDDVAGTDDAGSVAVFSFQADCDGDGVGLSGGDCDPFDPDVRADAPEICDGIDNDCDLQADEALCSEFEVNDDGVVDGHELGWLGRAFGMCSDHPAAKWWSRVDYTADGCVDGNDLAILAFVWDCAGAGLICEP